MDLNEIIAAILNPGGRNSAGGMPPMPSRPGEGTPQPAMPMQAFQQAPMRAPMQASMRAQTPQQQGAPQQGGFGQAIGGLLQGLVDPQASGRNQTVGWLTKQGLDEGTATLLAANKPALQSYLLQRSRGNGPTEFDQRAAAAQQYGLDPRSDEGRAFILGGDLPKNESPKPTSDIQNYQFATQNGYQGSFADWQKDKGGGVNVNLPGAPNIGTIPPGYAARQDPQTGAWSMEPIAGGPAAQKAAASENAASLAKQSSERNANIVVQDIDRALGMVEKSPRTTTGVGGLVLSNVPGTDAYDTNKLLDTVKANAGFDRLQAMRDASPTGGALGQVSEREMSFLQSAIGNLEQSQGTQQFTDNLKRVKNIYLDIIYGAGQGPQRAQTSFEGGSGNADPLGIR